MRLRQSHVLFAVNAAFMLAGVAVTYGLMAMVATDEPAPSASAAVPDGFRLTFVRPGALWRDDTAAPDAGTAPLLKPGEADQVPVSGTGGWSTAVLPPLRPQIDPGALPPPGRKLAALPPASVPSSLSGAARHVLKPKRGPLGHTLKSRLAELSPAAEARLAEKFAAAKAAWPPSEVALVALKDERVVELHARAGAGPWTPVHRYRVQAASGGMGPKLVQGDKQVPEGIYRIVFLNPNSAYHVSLRVNYPNAFDRKMAAADGRRNLGGDIMIHGKRSSAGCLAMGDEAAEELFVLAARTGLAKVRLIIAPSDFRLKGLPPSKPGEPRWLPKLYSEIAVAMATYKTPEKAPQSKGLLSFLFKS